VRKIVNRKYVIPSKIEQITVNAVYPGDNTSKLFSHRVTVAEMDGRIYYLSNEISGDEEPDLWWHADRLSDGEWDEKI
jgi:hypothetical protein